MATRDVVLELLLRLLLSHRMHVVCHPQAPHDKRAGGGSFSHTRCSHRPPPAATDQRFAAWASSHTSNLHLRSHRSICQRHDPQVLRHVLHASLPCVASGGLPAGPAGPALHQHSVLGSAADVAHGRQGADQPGNSGCRRYAAHLHGIPANCLQAGSPGEFGCCTACSWKSPLGQPTQQDLCLPIGYTQSSLLASLLVAESLYVAIASFQQLMQGHVSCLLCRC